MWQASGEIARLRAEVELLRQECDQMRVALRDVARHDQARREAAERELDRLRAIARASGRLP